MDLGPSLQTKAVARTIEHHACLSSTNDRAKALYAAGAPHGTLVVADRQTGGRGRRGRAWHSPEGAGLYASFLLRPKLAAHQAPLVSLAAGLALFDAAEAWRPGLVGLKWPNDLLVVPDHPRLAFKKLGGVLVELELEGGAVGAVVVGIGVNLVAATRPPEVEAVASYFAALAGRTIASEIFLAQLANGLERELDDLEAGRGADVIARWKERAIGMGQSVTVFCEDTGLDGVMEGVDENGALQLRVNGEVRVIWAGDLRLLGMPKKQQEMP